MSKITIHDIEMLIESMNEKTVPATKLKVSPNDYYRILAWSSMDDSIDTETTLTHLYGYHVEMDLLREDGNFELC